MNILPSTADDDNSSQVAIAAEGTTFPLKLHLLLEETEKRGFSSIISWEAHGTAFMVHNKQLFSDMVMPEFFDSTNYKVRRRDEASVRRLHVESCVEGRDPK